MTCLNVKGFNELNPLNIISTRMSHKFVVNPGEDEYKNEGKLSTWIHQN